MSITRTPNLSPKKGLLYMRREKSPLITLCTLRGHGLWFASTWRYRSNWPKFAIFSASNAGEANTAD